MVVGQAAVVRPAAAAGQALAKANPLEKTELGLGVGTGWKGAFSGEGERMREPAGRACHSHTSHATLRTEPGHLAAAMGSVATLLGLVPAIVRLKTLIHRFIPEK